MQHSGYKIARHITIHFQTTQHNSCRRVDTTTQTPQHRATQNAVHSNLCHNTIRSQSITNTQHLQLAAEYWINTCNTKIQYTQQNLPQHIITAQVTTHYLNTSDTIRGTQHKQQHTATTQNQHSRLLETAHHKQQHITSTHHQYSSVNTWQHNTNNNILLQRTSTTTLATRDIITTHPTHDSTSTHQVNTPAARHPPPSDSYWLNPAAIYGMINDCGSFKWLPLRFISLIVTEGKGL